VQYFASFGGAICSFVRWCSTSHRLVVPYVASLENTTGAVACWRAEPALNDVARTASADRRHALGTKDTNSIRPTASNYKRLPGERCMQAMRFSLLCQRLATSFAAFVLDSTHHLGQQWHDCHDTHVCRRSWMYTTRLSTLLDIYSLWLSKQEMATFKGRPF
jgi:hypothetical protein